VLEFLSLIVTEIEDVDDTDLFAMSEVTFIIYRTISSSAVTYKLPTGFRPI
jgi:hypothetical protein